MEQITVLLVEDEQDIRELLTQKLRSQGFLVHSIDRGDLVVKAMEAYKPDIVLLDQIMPGKMGIDVLRELRESEQFSSVPVIMVTGLGGEGEKLEAFNSGADDYVTKPFMSKELGARINAVMRRAKGSGAESARPNQLVNSNLVVDFSAHKVFVDESEVKLTLTEFKLLSELLVQAGRVLSRDQLREKVLGRLSITDRTIDVHMAALRKKLGGRGGDIQTVRGVGYRFTRTLAAH
ncbi:MAG: response regulator transcription factor [Bdellovibrionales bacterium]